MSFRVSTRPGAESGPMPIQDHRPRVAAERRERMRMRLLSTAIRLGAQRGPAAITIDDVVVGAEVSRGSFYKYFASTDALFRDLATQIANELIRMAEPAVLGFDDPAERVAAGIRLVARTAIDHPTVAAFLVRLGWPDVGGPDILLDFLRRDLDAGMRQRRFTRMPIALALNIVAGAVIGATHCMLAPGCESDFAEQTAAAALRALGLDAAEARRIATRPLRAVELPTSGVFAETVEHASRGVAPPRPSGPATAPAPTRPAPPPPPPAPPPAPPSARRARRQAGSAS
jgi:AcrR family transcriptional regulator